MKNTIQYDNQDRLNFKKGDILLSVLIFAAIAVTVIIGLTNWGASALRSIRTVAQKEQAFQIAEAGVDYYQWHLAQYPSDYRDGTATSGPYVHNLYDKDGDLLGSYSLTITPPLVGSTIVKILSTGTLASSTISRTVQKTMAIPSLAKYAVVANDGLRFGEGTEVFGPVHSNGGIRFDGVAHNIISSSLTQYNDTDSDDCNAGQSFGVHTCVNPDDPSPPAAMPIRSDVFMAGRQVGIPTTNFAGLTAGLTTLHDLAQPAVGGKLWASSGVKGYQMIFKVSGGVTSYDMYKVKRVEPIPSGCGTDSTARAQVQWDTWSIRTPLTSTNNRTLVGNYAIPANGVIFVEDNVWVEGQINNARVTIVAGIIGNTDPEDNSNITINNDLIYTNYNGSDVIALIAQGNVNVGLRSENDIRIDAALVAEKGRVGRFYYNNSCKLDSVDYYRRNSITLYGMIATYIRYGFAYTDNTGYTIRNITYDGNLLYGPPPSFPQASSQYQVISWQQIK